MDSETAKYDPSIYSNISQNGQRLTWKELYEESRKEISRLRKFQIMVMDLDRNEHGRHQGDIDTGDHTGVSRGNPNLMAGQVLGYSLGGGVYVVPERDKRHDPDAWGPFHRD
jgi:hypothetical protein